ncbi:sulfatase-like hydrolase/transferase [Flavobacteriaceae bacterium]|nr:sulfatase-like hydrolase/transferase [Flavobacteriaceae bacterium]
MKYLRLNEYKALLYRVLLVYLMYSFSRFLFFIYNYSLLEIDSLFEYFRLSYHGLAFDTTSIFYLNSLFVVLSILPFWVNTNKTYQRFLFTIYFLTNLVGIAFNFVDLIYYKFNYNRTTISEWAVIENENNLFAMFFRFMVGYWDVFLLFFLMSAFWILLYKKVKVHDRPYSKGVFSYVSTSIVTFLLTATIMVGGIRGDFKKSTRPINLVDANRYVNKIQHADFVLNTPFTILRTFNKKTFKRVPYVVPDLVIDSLVQPIKRYKNKLKVKPNIVLFITESYGREYIGAFNQNTNIPDYKSYTPFLDSLATKSLVFDNAFANGRKSIHGMSSILAGIPSFKDAFTSSPYANQEIESVVSVLNSEGYDTSFFHGAPNGSMGFLGFSNILGFDHYYGKTEFGNDSLFDGFWGIWDLPFFQFMKDTIDTKNTPFFSTIFTVTSHEPYIIPNEFEGQFPKGNLPMHQCVGYTDFAFKQFFESAKNEEWFDNTIFIITADHTNQVDYKEYYKPINRYAIPIMIYSPDNKYAGLNSDLSQQIDIYPTILNIVGYDKPFRSWGRSLVDESLTSTVPFVMNFNGQNYQYSKGNIICIFDGVKAIGFYDINDLGLEINLISNRTKKMDDVELSCKAFLKDYFDRIIDKKL